MERLAAAVLSTARLQLVNETTGRNAVGILKGHMRCPVCQREFEKESSTAVPFCSERCRTIDLGRWLGETYRLPGAPDPDADQDESVEPKAANGNGVTREPS
jgi:endogenous inhibitor of DNA gyrase (YacG/DUF329 family)